MIHSLLILGACYPELQYKNYGPKIEVISPQEDDVFNVGQGVQFEVSVHDPTDLPTDLTVRWESDLEGLFLTATSDDNGVLILNYNELGYGTHNIKVRVQDTEGLYSEDSVKITINALPPAPQILLTPSQPDTTKDLKVNITEVEDVDGDDLEPLIKWYQNGLQYEAGDNQNEISSEFTQKGDIWSVEVQMNDGIGLGESTVSTVEIGNSTPKIDTIEIVPSENVYNDTSLECVVEATDVDEDEIIYSFQWEILTDGEVIVLNENQSTLILDSSLAKASSRVYCIASAQDESVSVHKSTYIEVSNRIPEITDLQITPGTGIRDGTELQCLAETMDSDQDETTLSYSWNIDGAVLSTDSHFTFSSDYGEKGDVLNCIATVVDTHGGTSELHDSVTVSNSAPIVNAVSINPISPKVSDTLTCASIATDIDTSDNESLMYSYIWTVDESIQSETSDTLSSGYSKGQTVYCEVVVTDGEGESASLQSSVVIGNSSPILYSIEIQPNEDVYNDSTVECIVDASDVDNDALVYQYQWDVLTNGTLMTLNENQSTLSLSHSLAEPFSRVYCQVTISDDEITLTDQNYIDLSNRSPQINEINITPSTGIRDGSVLSCSGSTNDADQDQMTLRYIWINGDVVLSTESTYIFDAEHGVKGDHLTCTITAEDSHGTSSEFQTFVVVANTIPTITQISLLPENPTSQDSLSCIATTYDIDDDDVELSYTWMIDQTLQPETSSTLQGPLGVGSEIICTITPDDLDDMGESESISVIIENTPPVIDNVVYDYETIYTDTLVTASATAADIDGDEITLTYDWYIDGELIYSGPAPSLNGEDHFDKGEQIWVVVNAFDGSESGLEYTADVKLIANTPPIPPEIQIGNGYTHSDSDVYCSILTEATDPDGDPIFYTFDWELDDVPVSSLMSSMTTYSDDTILPINTVPGETYKCIITTEDDTDSVVTTTESAITACELQYIYNLNTDFFDLDNIQDCWSVNYFTTVFDIESTLLRPFTSVVSGDETGFNYPFGADTVLLVDGYNDGTIVYNYSDSYLYFRGSNYGPPPIGPGLSVHTPSILKWMAPVHGECLIDIDISGNGGGFGSNTKEVVLYQGNTEVLTVEVSGSLTNINETLDLTANEYLTFVFDPSGRNNYDFSGISQSADYFMGLDGSIQCTFEQ